MAKVSSDEAAELKLSLGHCPSQSIDQVLFELLCACTSLLQQATVTNYPRLSGLKQQKASLSPSWSPDMENQGAVMVGSFLDMEGRVCSMSLF
jgi:hypothetical protein